MKKEFNKNFKYMYFVVISNRSDSDNIKIFTNNKFTAALGSNEIKSPAEIKTTKIIFDSLKIKNYKTTNWDKPTENNLNIKFKNSINKKLKTINLTATREANKLYNKNKFPNDIENDDGELYQLGKTIELIKNTLYARVYLYSELINS